MATIRRCSPQPAARRTARSVRLALGSLLLCANACAGGPPPRNVPSDPATGTGAVFARQSVRGLRASVYGANGERRARLHIDELTVEPMQVAGPFRLGFLREARAGDVSIEMAHRGSEMRGDRGDVADLVGDFLALTGVPARLTVGLASVEVDHLTLINRGLDGVLSTRVASQCRVDMRRKDLRCRSGSLYELVREEPASCGGKRKKGKKRGQPPFAASN